MEYKKIFAIDMILIVGSLFAIIFIVGYAHPLIISPIDNLETSRTNVLFSVEKADRILIDDNINFTSPESYGFGDGLVINLKPGTYYWKAVGVLESEIRTLTINSEINLRLRKLEDGDFAVVNAGNERLNVKIYNGTEKISEVELDVFEETKEKGTKYVGGKNG